MRVQRKAAEVNLRYIVKSRYTYGGCLCIAMSQPQKGKMPCVSIARGLVYGVFALEFVSCWLYVARGVC